MDCDNRAYNHCFNLAHTLEIKSRARLADSTRIGPVTRVADLSNDLDRNLKALERALEKKYSDNQSGDNN